MPRKSTKKPAKTEAKVQSEPENPENKEQGQTDMSDFCDDMDVKADAQGQAAESEPEAQATPTPAPASTPTPPPPSPTPDQKAVVKEVRVNIKLTEDLYQIYQKEAQDHAMPTASLMAYALKEYADANFCDAFPALDAAQVAAAAAIAAQMMAKD